MEQQEVGKAESAELIAKHRAIVAQMRTEYGTRDIRYKRALLALARVMRTRTGAGKGKTWRERLRLKAVKDEAKIRVASERAHVALEDAQSHAKARALQIAIEAAPRLMEARVREAFPKECPTCKHHAQPPVGTGQYRAMVKAQDELQEIVIARLRPDFNERKEKQPVRKIVRVDWPSEAQKT